MLDFLSTYFRRIGEEESVYLQELQIEVDKYCASIEDHATVALSQSLREQAVLDVWVRRLKNRPVVAFFVIAFIVVEAIIGFITTLKAFLAP